MEGVRRRALRLRHRAGHRRQQHRHLHRRAERQDAQRDEPIHREPIRVRHRAVRI